MHIIPQRVTGVRKHLNSYFRDYPRGLGTWDHHWLVNPLEVGESTGECHGIWRRDSVFFSNLKWGNSWGFHGNFWYGITKWYDLGTWDSAILKGEKDDHPWDHGVSTVFPNPKSKTSTIPRFGVSHWDWTYWWVWFTRSLISTFRCERASATCRNSQSVRFPGWLFGGPGGLKQFVFRMLTLW